MNNNLLIQLNTAFALFEQNLKSALAELVKERPTETILPLISAFAQLQAASIIRSTYLVSISVLVDDIFDISFSPDSNNEKKWFEFSYLETGHLGRCCREAIKTNKRLHALAGKPAMAAANLSQKKIFITDANMEIFYVTPVVIGEHIVGTIQLSLSKDDPADRELAENFLTWLVDKISWILLSEQARLSSVLDTARTISRALDIKDEYQSNHSKNVAKIASYFMKEISRSEEYLNVLFPDGKRPDGISAMQLKLAALLHDTGKLIMSNKSFEHVKNLADYCKRQMHPFYTDMVLSHGRATKGIARLASMHHEKTNGDGYPFGSTQNDMSIESQIISFADVIDSWARERPDSHTRKSMDEIITCMTANRIRNKFTPAVYSILLAILHDFRDTPGICSDDLKTLMGLTSRDEVIKFETNTEFDDLLNKCGTLTIPNLLNRWVIFIAFCGNTDAVHNHLGGKFKIKRPELKEGGRYLNHDCEGATWSGEMHLINAKESNHVFGIHITNKNRDVAYALCESIYHLLKNEKLQMAAAFVNAEYLKDKDKMIKLRDLLTTSTQSMSQMGRWKLLSPSQISL